MMTANSQKFACGFCKKSFRNERTLASHMCVKKRRKLEEGNVASRMGFELFRRFFELNSPTKNAKSFDDFIDSRYYTTFIKFARFLMDLRPVDQGRFIDFVFQNGIKERDWCKDTVYNAYVLDLLAKEPASRGLERSIKTMNEWAEESGRPFSEFFIHIPPAQATHLIRMGRISPWALYFADSADHLWSRLSDEQGQIISSVINPKIWRTRFELKKDDCNFSREILKEAGL